MPNAIYSKTENSKIYTLFPGNGIDNNRMSPFYLLDYNITSYFPPDDITFEASAHPHRGQEIITYIIKGQLNYLDSNNNNGYIQEGNIQWLTSGSGILHKEYHDKEFYQNGGQFQALQIWVNLPAEHKFTSPKYQNINKELFGSYPIPNEKGSIKVIAGNYKNISGPAKTFSPIHLYIIDLKQDGIFNIELPENYNTGLMMIEGSILINTNQIKENNFIIFKNHGTNIPIKANLDSSFLLISGEPINEPTVKHGPFLMNSINEIEQAISEYNEGKFGLIKEN